MVLIKLAFAGPARAEFGPKLLTIPGRTLLGQPLAGAITLGGNMLGFIKLGEIIFGPTKLGPKLDGIKLGGKTVGAKLGEIMLGETTLGEIGLLHPQVNTGDDITSSKIGVANCNANSELLLFCSKLHTIINCIVFARF